MAAANPFDTPLNVSDEEQHFIIAEQLREIDIKSKSILLEPINRNTAPAVALPVLQLIASDPDVVMLVMPSDHVIANFDAFVAVMNAGHSGAIQGKLITFRIVPTAGDRVIWSAATLCRTLDCDVLTASHKAMTGRQTDMTFARLDRDAFLVHPTLRESIRRQTCRVPEDIFAKAIR